ncbi:MAG: bifunctional methylenetetrahydrofolate dehydrogenase/methenyltetrahydrofolate cyclohydrolase FolD [Alphaproteobacteria bacterium]|nr:bifunctional methylenetetrahydrofolate dehydrogenase/methenyltetrahydrofolate cyclohydrolase FolD [Alphaproteobacteria bacterium]|tara:strand:+ start:1998 stop:2894 length:897 start_codon:yes stop_codon:yes gene_type:complete
MTDAEIIDGKAFAQKLRSKITAATEALKKQYDGIPGLAVVLVGEDPASEVYVRNKGKQTLECGMASYEHKLTVTVSQDELLDLIKKLNINDDVDGILVQLPLPDHIDPQAVLDAINPEKDVDGFHVINAGRLATGGDALVPCTPLGCLLMLKDYFGDLSGKNAVVVGRSNIVGKPMAALLTKESCTVTIAHSRTKNLPSVCRSADILIAAVGKPEMIRGDWIGNNTVVIDVGINRIPAPERGEGKMRLVGDVHFAEAKAKAKAITPVPGGVGPMTIAVLLRNTIQAACRRRNWNLPDL